MGNLCCPEPRNLYRVANDTGNVSHKNSSVNSSERGSCGFNALKVDEEFALDDHSQSNGKRSSTHSKSSSTNREKVRTLSSEVNETLINLHHMADREMISTATAQSPIPAPASVYQKTFEQIQPRPGSCSTAKQKKGGAILSPRADTHSQI